MAVRLIVAQGWGGLLDTLADEVSTWNTPLDGGRGYPGGWVVLPSRPLIQAFQDALSVRKPGVLNVRVSSLDQLARNLRDPRDTTQRVPWGLWERFIKEKLRGMEKTPLFPALELEGLQDAIFRTVQDLRMTGASTFGTGLLKMGGDAFDNVPKISAVRNVYNAWVKRLREEGLWDRADLYRNASARLASSDDGRALLEADRVLALLPPFLHGLQQNFLEALGRGKAELILLTVQVPGVRSTAHARWIDAFRGASDDVRAPVLPPLSGIDPFVPPAGGRTADGCELVTLSAPGPEAECREAVRECLRFAGKGIPFHEMAVLLRHPREYLPLLAGALSRAGIPFGYRGGNLSTMIPEARSLLAILEGVAEEDSRALLFAGLRAVDLDGSAFTGDGNPLPANRWDRITRESGAVRGREAILAGLEALAEKAEDEEGGRSRGATPSGVAEIEGCRAGLEALFASLDRVCLAPDWALATRALLDLVTRLYRGSPGRALLHHVLATLADLDAGALAVDPKNVFEAASELLEEGAVSSGRVKRGGVNLLPLDRASGLDFRAVILPGMALRRFPPPPREDPILLDEERIRLRDDPAFATLTPRSHRLGEEAYHFASAVAGAREHLVLGFPGYDPAMGRAQAPSTFLLRVHEAREGRNLDLETLMEHHVTTVPVFTGFNEREPADTPQAFDRRLLAGLDTAGRKAFLEKVSPEYKRMACRRAALLNPSRLSPYDGWMKSKEALEVVRKKFGKRPGFSPTGLESYARCPYRFFLERVVRIAPLEDPAEKETAEECEPMHKGHMVHEVLEKFHRWLAGEGKKKSPTEKAVRKALEDFAGEVFGAQEKAGTVGSPAVWEAERARLLEEMWAVVTDDLAGLDDFRPREFERNLTTLIDLPGKKGGRLSLFGYADRIDRSADGRAVRVVDYKVTSGRVKKKDESFQGGEALQLPLYLLMALEGMKAPDPDRSEGVYYFLSRKQGFRKVSFSGRDWKKKKKTLLRILQTIAESIRAGLFPLNPGRWDRFLTYYTHCSWCDYEIVCGKRRRDRMIEILETPPNTPARLKKYVEMGRVNKLWD